MGDRSGKVPIDTNNQEGVRSGAVRLRVSLVCERGTLVACWEGAVAQVAHRVWFTKCYFL